MDITAEKDIAKIIAANVMTGVYKEMSEKEVMEHVLGTIEAVKSMYGYECGSERKPFRHEVRMNNA